MIGIFCAFVGALIAIAIANTPPVKAALLRLWDRLRGKDDDDDDPGDYAWV